jgi:hypothetical protein
MPDDGGITCQHACKDYQTFKTNICMPEIRQQQGIRAEPSERDRTHDVGKVGGLINAKPLGNIGRHLHWCQRPDVFVIHPERQAARGKNPIEAVQKQPRFKKPRSHPMADLRNCAAAKKIRPPEKNISFICAAFDNGFLASTSFIYAICTHKRDSQVTNRSYNLTYYALARCTIFNNRPIKANQVRS